MVNTKEIQSFYPGTVEEVLVHMKPRTALIAGATQFMLNFEPHKKILPFQQLIFLENIAALKVITQTPETIHLGALCTAAQLAAAAEVPQVLQQAAAVVGSPALRERATVGGNVLTASPTGDMLAALYALDASVRLNSRQGERVLGLEQFILGPGKTAIREEELLTGIEFPHIDAGGQSCYLKTAAKHTNGISKVSLAAVLPSHERRGKQYPVRLAYGAVGATILRARALERLLQDRTGAEPAIAASQVRQLLADVLTPIDDIRSTA